jgi:hypothetical protein
MNDRSIVGKGIGPQWYGGHVGRELPAAVGWGPLGTAASAGGLFPVDLGHHLG